MIRTAEWPPATSGRWLERHDPADTSQLVSRAPSMTGEDVMAAIARAESAAPSWRTTTLHARGQALIDAAAIIRQESEELADLITRENGKTLAESRVEVGFTATCFDYYGNLARDPVGSMLSDRRPGAIAWTQREPLGVVAIVTPWNDPLATPARKIAPALLTGNAVVFKPARETPLSSWHLIDALVRGGVPEEVIQLVIGPSSEVADPILNADAVRAVSFTGSTNVGLAISRTLGGTTTRLQTEMGGKNATYVHPDGDLDLAVATILGSACGQAGQRCTATSRAIAHASIHDEFVERLVSAARKMKVGSGLEEGVNMGPLVSGEHLTAVIEAIDTARRQGASAAAGGTRLTDEGRERGHFLAPTVLTDVAPDMDVWSREVFAPVVSVASAGSLDDAIDLVNDSTYGLSSGIFTTDLAVAHAFIDRVDTGQVAVNLPTGGWDIHMPFGGFKESGSPFKENGTEGLRFYSRIKSVAMKHA